MPGRKSLNLIDVFARARAIGRVYWAAQVVEAAKIRYVLCCVCVRRCVRVELLYVCEFVCTSSTNTWNPVTAGVNTSTKTTDCKLTIALGAAECVRTSYEFMNAFQLMSYVFVLPTGSL